MPHTLLVADDSLTVQRVVALAFAGTDIEVSSVGTGPDAMVRLASNPPDILLADVSLGDPDAYALADYVRRRPACAGVRVVLLAGMFQPADDARATDLGCDGVIAKPLTPGYLVTRVRELLAGPPRRRVLSAEGPGVLPSGTPAAGQLPPAQGASPSGDRASSHVAWGMEAFVSEASASDPTALRAADDYFRRLDDAFRSLEQRGAPPADEDGEVPADEDDGAPVPTLQELLARLPEDSRTRISTAAVTGVASAEASAEASTVASAPPTSAQATAQDADQASDPLVDAITRRVLERLATDPGLMRALASRVAEAADRQES